MVETAADEDPLRRYVGPTELKDAPETWRARPAVARHTTGASDRNAGFWRFFEPLMRNVLSGL